MKVVYVAGPYRASTSWGVEQNIRIAEEVGMAIARDGAAPLIPHTLYRYFNGTLTDEFWLAATLELLKRCDAVMMAGKWARSAGAMAERATALELGLPVFDEGSWRQFGLWLMQPRLEA